MRHLILVPMFNSEHGMFIYEPGRKFLGLPVDGGESFEISNGFDKLINSYIIINIGGFDDWGITSTRNVLNATFSMFGSRKWYFYGNTICMLLEYMAGGTGMFDTTKVIFWYNGVLLTLVTSYGDIIPYIVSKRPYIQINTRKYIYSLSENDYQNNFIRFTTERCSRDTFLRRCV